MVLIAPDAALSTAISNSVKIARYVVPTRRQEYIKHAELNDIIGDGNEATNICIEDIVAPEEVNPTFRTPCRYIMVGQIATRLALS